MLATQIFDGKCALITGATSGIGRSVAQLLAERGCAIAMPYSIAVDKGTDLRDESVANIRAAGGRVEPVEADISNIGDIKRMFAAAVQTLGRLDFVINCAGVMAEKLFVDVSEADYDRVFTINTKGTFFVLQEAARHVVDGGRVVAFSSPASRMGGPTGALYCGSKASVEGFVRCLAWELAARSITVNAIAPGMTDTPMLTPFYRERGAAMTPFGRLGQPTDVAAAVLLLLQPEAHWITGQTLFAGGGVYMG